MEKYQPIACIEHEKLEFAVLRHQRLHLSYFNAERQVVEAEVLPLDVYTEAGAEWLKFTTGAGAATPSVIRLDAIVRFSVLAG